MVRGNWQKRVESAQARRDATRQRKQKRDERGNYKAELSQFLNYLDCANIVGEKSKDVFHLWVMESLPSSTDQQTNDTSSDRAPHRPKWTSKNNKKSKHPRSNTNNNNTDVSKNPDDYEDQKALLWRNHFYFNKKNDGSGATKKNAKTKKTCDLDIGQTLFQCLTMNGKQQVDDASLSLLSKCEKAASGQIGTLFYIRLTIKDEKEDESSSPLSEKFVSKLSEHDFCISKLVYVVVNGCLIFDKFRGGSQTSLRKMSDATDDIISRKISCDLSEYIAVNLPGQMLEHILTFMGDSCSGVLPKVCKAWNNEIQNASPFLWRSLMMRNRWPFLLQSDNNEEESPSSETLRSIYVSHYRIVYDLKAVKSSLCSFLGTMAHGEVTNTSVVKSAIQVFKSTKGAPQPDDQCVSLKNFSSNIRISRVLGAYQDGTLRIFESAAGGNSSSSSRNKTNHRLFCRQTVSMKFIPKTAKKNEWKVLTMDIDDSYVSCLCQTSSPLKDFDEFLDRFRSLIDNSIIQPVLVGVSKEDLLCAAGGGQEEDVVNVVLLNEAVLDYFSRAYQELGMSFGLQPNDVFVKATNNIVMCGRGLCALEMAIFWRSGCEPTLIDATTENYSNQQSRYLNRNICLYSFSENRVMWIQSYPTSQTYLHSHRRPQPSIRPSFFLVGGRSSSTYADLPVSPNIYGDTKKKGRNPKLYDVVLLSNSFPSIFHCQVDILSGYASNMNLVSGSPRSWIEMERKGWQLYIPQNEQNTRKSCVAGDVCVVGDTFERVVEDDSEQDAKLLASALFFYDLGIAEEGEESQQNESGPFILKNCELLRLESNKENHAVAICREHPPSPTDINGIDGQWFEAEENSDQKDVYITAIVVHIPTRKEVERIDLLRYSNDTDFVFDVSSSCLAFGINSTSQESSGGVILAGTSLCDMLLDEKKMGEGNNESPKKTPKKKKQSKNSRTNKKKDGFARGMSVRG